MMLKRILIAAAIVCSVVTGFYLFIRYRFLKAKDFPVETSDQKNIVDLRPSLTAKLQQMVKDASGGLYILSVEKAEAKPLSSTLDLVKGIISVDTAIMKSLDSLHRLPDNIYTIRFSSLHIDGLGVDDLFSKKGLKLSGVTITNPVIDIYHSNRAYNKNGGRDVDTLKKLEIGEVRFVNGTVIHHDESKGKTKKFVDVSMVLNDIIIDSSGHKDRNRFLYARNATISTKNYSVPTNDGLYYFKAGNISMSWNNRTINARNISLVPRYSRQQFVRKLKYSKDMYNIHLPAVVVKDVNIEALLNNGGFSGGTADINGGTFSIFFDRSVPQGPIQKNNFPHQALMKLPFPFSVKKCYIRNLDLAYEEHNPLTGKSGTVYFDKITGSLSNVTNIPAEIRQNKYTTLSAITRFMHKVPLNIQFRYDLARSLTGEFIADVKMETLDKVSVNPIAEPLGLFSIKEGQMKKAVIHVEGNNSTASGNISMQYNDLHLTPLKKDESGELKKRTVTGFLANMLIIKNDNPKDGDMRQPVFTVERGTHKNFFNFLWTSILMGVVRTVGIPDKFVRK